MVNCITERRFGRIRITRALLETLTDADLKTLFELLGFVFKSDESLTSEEYTWTFSNPLLTKVELENQIPEYTVTIFTDVWGRKKLILMLNGVIMI